MEHLRLIDAEPPQQIGLRMGRQRSGRLLVAIDVDGSVGDRSFARLQAELGPLPATLTQHTGGGGRHYVLEWPLDLADECPTTSAGKLGIGIDIRGARGVIVAAPSLHESGQQYAVINDVAPAQLPDAWVARIVQTHGTEPVSAAVVLVPHAPDELMMVIERAGRYVARMPPAISGAGGHLATWRVAQVLVRGFALDRSHAYQLLKAYNARCQPPWSESELAHKLDSAERRGRMPRGCLRGPHARFSVASWQSEWDVAPPAPEVIPAVDDNTERVAAQAESSAVSASQRPDAPNRVAVTPLTDLGNAERFVARFGDRVRFCPQRKSWLVWDGIRWVWDETGEVMRLAKKTARGIYDEASRAGTKEDARTIAKHASDSEKAARLHAMVDLVASEPAIPVTPAKLDADPWKLNVRNGTINLRTGILGPHDSRDLITKLVPISYDPEAQLDLWDRFLEDVTGADRDVSAFLQRVAGYCATGLQIEKQFYFIYSRQSDTGKSTFADALRAALGDYAVDADFETWLEQSATGGNRGDLARLTGARLVLSIEVRRRAKFDAKLIKAVTGGDPLTCAAKYEKEFTYRPQFKILLVANDAPMIRDDDRPMFERCLRVPFDARVSVARKDSGLKRRLSDPADGGPAVLKWLVDGCLAWQREGINPPAAVQNSSAAYAAEMNGFRQFIDEACVLQPSALVSKQELRSAYEAWCEEAGVRPLNQREVTERLHEVQVAPSKGSGGKRIWRGIQLKSLQDDDESGSGTRGSSGVVSANSPHESHADKHLGNGATRATLASLSDKGLS